MYEPKAEEEGQRFQTEWNEVQKKFISFMSRQDEMIDSVSISAGSGLSRSSVYRMLEKYAKVLKVAGEIHLGKKRSLYVMKDRYKSAIADMRDTYGIDVTEFF